MAIAPVFQEKLAAAKQEGRQEGTEEGRQEAQRSILENFWRSRFGESTPSATVWFAPVSVLPAAEFTELLIQLWATSSDREAIKLLAEAARLSG